MQLNIAEGYALGSRAAFRRHLSIAYGSAVETGDLLELLIEKQLGPVAQAQRLLALIHRTQGLLLGLLERYRPRP